MNASSPSFLVHPLEWFRGGQVVISLALLAIVPGAVQAGMIGTGVTPRAVAAGDLNGDSYTDLVSGNTGDGNVSVSLGRGNGTFAPKVLFGSGGPVFGVALADLNNDGHLDVVSCSPSIGMIGIRFGAGDGTLGARTDYVVNDPTAVVAVDLTGDGLVDLAITSSTPPHLTVMHATGPGTFGAPAAYGGVNAGSLAVGDLNADGDLDIVTANATGVDVQVYLAVAPGVYGLPVGYPMMAASSGIVLADFNHDNALDIAATIANLNMVNVRLGVGNGTFGATSGHGTAASPQSIVSADLNGDTHADLVVTANGSHAVTVMLGTGSGTFQPPVDYPAGVAPLGVAAAHLDMDSNLDLAIAASGSNSICTLPGAGGGTFQIPSGPVYVWAPAAGTAFDPNAWLPARNTGTASDILVFNRGGVVTVSNVPNSTIGQLVISGGTEASFSGFLGAAALTVAGGSGDDAIVELGSKSVLASGGSPVSVNMASGANAIIDGDIEIRGGNNRIQALDVFGILFRSTGRAIIGPGSSTTPFGNATGASGQSSVVFHYGSRFIAQAPVAVFGATYPVEVVEFLPGSRFRMDVAFSPEVSGRTYADFEYNVPAGNTSLTGSDPWTVDSLIVTQGTLSVEMTGDVLIEGNVVISVCTGPNQLRFVPPSPATYRFGGAARQYVYSTNPGCPGNVLRVYASPNVTWNIDNPAGVHLSHGWRTASNIHFTQGNIGNFNFWQLVSDSSAAITGASQSTGWVETQLTRRVTADGPVLFAVGDSANYLPVVTNVNGVTFPGYILAGTYAWDYPGIGNAQLDLDHLVHRSWVVDASNDFGNVVPPTFFGNLDATVSFVPSDVDPGSDPLQFELRKTATGAVWASTTTGVRTATSIQALGLTPTSVNETSWLAAGEPVTPSLSVSDASESEGNGPAPGASAERVSSGPMAPASFARAEDMAWQPAGEIGAPPRAMGGCARSSAAAGPIETQSAGSLSFRVRLSQAAVVPVSVDYQTVDGTATVADGDYTPVSGTLHFAPGDTAQDVVVPFGVDTTPERNETFGITISNASNATIAAPTATGTILDDDDLIAPTALVIEPNGGEVIHQNQKVDLKWTATDNVAVSGVDIQLVNGSVVTTLESNYPNTGTYRWIASGPASTKMRFRVVAHDDPGHTTTDNSDAFWELDLVVLDAATDLPIAFALSPPWPNPSPAGRNRIAFSVPHEARVRLTVHDVQGRTLATLAEGHVPAGRHERIWQSAGVAAGVYFVRFEAPGFQADRRLVVVR